ncbi:hypothetical protein LSAT2_005404 [Lamellibrachia satsuma]|nr:hypothetical protein LSAT2_005404 [Lamellibrachia satsuma]
MSPLPVSLPRNGLPSARHVTSWHTERPTPSKVVRRASKSGCRMEMCVYRIRETAPNKRNAADAIQIDDIDKFYDRRLLGLREPDVLRFTVWMNNGINVNCRVRQDHINMLWGDVDRTTSTFCGVMSTGPHQHAVGGGTGLQRVWVSTGKNVVGVLRTTSTCCGVMSTERATKTTSGASIGDHRQVNPKLFAGPRDVRCPVAAYKTYASHRPAAMLMTNSRFYVRSLNPVHKTMWYTRQPVVKDTLGNYMKTLQENGGL